MLPSNVSGRTSHSFGVLVILLLLSVLLVAAFVLISVPEEMLTLLAGGILGFVVCLVLGGKSILGIIEAVFIIGYFQGAIELFVTLPISLGILKYALLLGGGVFWLLRLMISKRLRISRRVLAFAGLCLLFYVLFARMMVPAWRKGEVDIELLTEMISLWAVFNIPLALLVYFDLKEITPVYDFLRTVVWLGIFAAAVGLGQYLIGPNRLQALGIDVYNMRFALLQSDEVSEFRVFSTFQSHYEFASFMVLSILAKLVLQFRAHRRPGMSSLITFFLLLGGLLVTFNITLWLTLAASVGVMLLGMWGKGMRVLLSKKAWRLAFATLILGLLALIVIPPFRDRVVGIFAFEKGAVGTAGRSLYWRTEILKNNLGLIKEFPGGLGPTAKSAISLLQARRGWFATTSDVFFAWLSLVGGIPLFLSYLLLWIVPLSVSFRCRGRIPTTDRPLFWAIWALLFVGVVLGGVSNAALLNGTPTNLLTWASLGVLLKVVDQFSKQTQQRSYNGESQMY